MKMMTIKECPVCDTAPYISLKNNDIARKIYLNCKCSIKSSDSFELDTTELAKVIDLWNLEVKRREEVRFPKTIRECMSGVPSHLIIVNSCDDLSLKDYGLFKYKPSVSKALAFMRLTLIAEIYNNGWVWGGPPESYFWINNNLYARESNFHQADVKFKSAALAKEFAKNFGHLLMEFYSL